MKHKHIPLGNGHITWTGEDKPTEDVIKAFEEIAELALSLPLVNCQRKQLKEKKVDYFGLWLKENKIQPVDGRWFRYKGEVIDFILIYKAFSMEKANL